MESRVKTRMDAGIRRDALVATVIDLVAARGMEGVTVREVASAADVSIGTVQHHFRTKDDLLVAAFGQVVSDTRERLAAVDPGLGRRDLMVAALSQLLPLDARRRREARVHVAFAARAAHTPTLQKVQRRLLAEIRGALAAALEASGSDPVVAGVDAAMLLAVVDGLAFHDASAPRAQSAATVVAVLERAVDLALGGAT